MKFDKDDVHQLARGVATHSTRMMRPESTIRYQRTRRGGRGRSSPSVRVWDMCADEIRTLVGLAAEIRVSRQHGVWTAQAIGPTDGDGTTLEATGDTLEEALTRLVVRLKSR